jgi:alcohol dehydrogenase
VAVFGCGGVGLAAVAIAAAAGARVLAVDLVPEKLALARELGASLVDRRGAASTRWGASASWTGGGADVPSTPSAAASPAPRASARCAGGAVTCSSACCSATTRIRRCRCSEVVRRELTVVGGHGMPARAYPRLFRFLERGRVPLGRLIGERRPLDEAGAALAAMERFAPVGVTLLHP